MIDIQYPEKKPSIRKEGEHEKIFCPARNRWVSLTPEEWVRQNLLLYLTDVLQYPLSLIAVEKQVKVGELNRRFDVLVYDRNSRPFLVLECKEMTIDLTADVLDQVLRYNIPIRAPYIFISNGRHCLGFRLMLNEMQALTGFPAFPVCLSLHHIYPYYKHK